MSWGKRSAFARKIGHGTKRGRNFLKQMVLEELRDDLEEMLPLVRRVIHQARQRIFHGNTRTEGKLLSVFEPSTEVIRKSLPPRRRGAKPPSPTNSARSSNYRRPRTRLWWTTKCMHESPTTATC